MSSRELELKNQICHKSANLKDLEKQGKMLADHQQDLEKVLNEMQVLISNPKKAPTKSFGTQDQQKLLHLNKSIDEFHIKAKDLQARFIQIQNMID